MEWSKFSSKERGQADQCKPSKSRVEESSLWEQRFGELERFKEQHGHVRVPRGHATAPELPVWLAAQKTRLADLSFEQLRRLWEIGIRFPGGESRWLFQFFKLRKIWEGSVGDDRFQAPEDDPALQSWIARQRTRQGRNLPRHRRRLLTEIGFIWDSRLERWEKSFAEVLAFKARFGHARIPPRWPENRRLALWLANQRRIVKDPKRRRRMEEAGCFLTREEVIWERRFQEWRDYVRRRGTTRFSVGSGKEKVSLAQWVAHVRIKKRAGKLEPDNIRRLEEEGFPWNPRSEQWERHFRALEEFHARHGHCRVGEVERRSDLAQWCWDQTRHRKLGEVPPERVARLDALGFVWNPREAFGQRMLEKLRRFHALHGHCRVPASWPDGKRLQGWVQRQRRALKKGGLSREWINQLAELPL